MSDAKRCDICGTFYDVSYDAEHWEITVTKKEGLAKVYYEDFDICKDCLKSIIYPHIKHSSILKEEFGDV